MSLVPFKRGLGDAILKVSGTADTMPAGAWCSPVAEHVPSWCEALGLSPRAQNKKADVSTVAGLSWWLLDVSWHLNP